MPAGFDDHTELSRAAPKYGQRKPRSRGSALAALLLLSGRCCSSPASASPRGAEGNGHSTEQVTSAATTHGPAMRGSAKIWLSAAVLRTEIKTSEFWFLVSAGHGSAQVLRVRCPCGVHCVRWPPNVCVPQTHRSQPRARPGPCCRLRGCP